MWIYDDLAGFVVLGYRHSQPFILCVDLCWYRHLLSVCVPSLLHWLRAEGLGAFNYPLSPPLILERSTGTALLAFPLFLLSFFLSFLSPFPSSDPFYLFIPLFLM
uniref:Uncharacterized protein n=1 Tax=Arundo donax TaxID=35708 RepID=A0A0A9GWZ9_ARUDO